MNSMMLVLALRDVFMAGLGALCFAVLFCVPQKHCFGCACNGALAWAVYLLVLQLQPSVVIATLCASVPLTLMARGLAIRQKAPVTVFLISGIFPLVPGASLYYTAYYFMHSENLLCVEKGIETLKVAIALAIGISIVLGIPFPQPRSTAQKEE